MPAVAAENVAPPDLAEVPELRRAVGARADLSVRGECPTGRGAVAVRGSVGFSTDRAADYVISVSWINDRSDVRARAVAVLRDVPAGKSADWTARTTLDADNATSCTYLVQRGALKR